MSTAILVVLAGLTLIFNPVRVRVIFKLLSLLYFNPVPTTYVFGLILIVSGGLINSQELRRI